MFRIDNASAVSALPAALAAGTPGYFGRGDPSTGKIPTILTADWANMVQEELVAVIAAAGIALDKTNRAQLLAALGVLFQPADSSILKVTAASLTQNGYLAFSNGFKACWGRFSALGNSNTTITFPLAFSSACFSAVVSGAGTGNDAQDNWPATDTSSITKTTFQVFSAADDALSTCFIAVGN
ncbi:hypothetical protein WBP07_12745 [Novosphingobium sp. BL-8A]|uniref:gp53-like domain-containing protein n=1 Tax=Novosphingobium sp. BL-8A TaxID=3127639 RepID=UPI0037565635